MEAPVETSPDVAMNVRCAACGARTKTFCGALDCSGLNHLMSVARTRTLAKHDTLMHEGEPAHAVFNITEGVVRLTRVLADGRRSVTGFLYAGDFAGLSVVDAYSYSAEAITPIKVCQFDRPKLEDMFRQYPQLEARLLEMVTHELIAAQNQMVLLGRKSLQERVATFLLAQASREEESGGDPDMISLPMTRSDIADYLGLTIETVSRCLTSFTKQGLVEAISKRSLRILDRDGLEGIAEAAA